MNDMERFHPKYSHSFVLWHVPNPWWPMYYLFSSQENGIKRASSEELFLNATFSQEPNSFGYIIMTSII